MLKTLIGRELLDNLMTFRFAAVLLITLLLVVANTVVLIQDYEQRLESYNDAVKRHDTQLRKAKTYSMMYLFVDRAPNPLSIFNVGLDKRLGNLMGIWHGFVPTLWDAQMHGTDNPFIAFFSSIDIVFVFEVILSLMGLIFAYDAIAGERERGYVTSCSRTTYRTRADPTGEIYQCDGVSVGPADIESTLCPAVVNPFDSIINC